MLLEKQAEIEKELTEGVPWQKRDHLENRSRLTDWDIAGIFP